MNDILVVEDEALIAMDVERSLEDAELGPVKVCNSKREAEDYLSRYTPRAAVLDMNLGRGETSISIAQELVNRGCAVTFLSGYTGTTVVLPNGLAGVRRIGKPFRSEDLISAARSMDDGSDRAANAD